MKVIHYEDRSELISTNTVKIAGDLTELHGAIEYAILNLGYRHPRIIVGTGQFTLYGDTHKEDAQTILDKMTWVEEMIVTRERIMHAMIEMRKKEQNAD